MIQAPTWPGMARDTAGSSMRRTASPRSCSVYVPSPIRSRYRASNSATRPAAAADCRVTAYVEWVLGASAPRPLRSSRRRWIPDPARCSRAIRWNAAFGSRVAFLDMGGRQTSWTADRREFIGRNGALADPAGSGPSTGLSGAVGAGLDPCGVLQTVVELGPGDEIEIVFFLGEPPAPVEAAKLISAVSPGGS